MGHPFVDGGRVAVEWWTTMVDDGNAVTLPGYLLLRFEEDGSCSDLREYWHVEVGMRRAVRRLGYVAKWAHSAQLASPAPTPEGRPDRQPP